jgi:hypothetical protein
MASEPIFSLAISSETVAVASLNECEATGD